MALSGIERQKIERLAIAVGFPPAQAGRLPNLLDKAFAGQPALQSRLRQVSYAGLDPDARSLLKFVGLIGVGVLALWLGPEILAAITVKQALGLLIAAIALYIAAHHPIDQAKQLYHTLLKQLSNTISGTDVSSTTAPILKKSLDRLPA